MTDQLRVLHVVPYFPPDRLGGVGEVACHIHQGLLQLGHKSIVLTAGTSDDDPHVRRIAKTPTGFILRCGLHGNMLRDVDIVHCHHGETLGLLLANKLRGFNIPVVCTYHCSCSGIGRAHRPYTIMGHRFGGDWKARAQRRLIAPLRHQLDRLALRLVDGSNFISRDGAQDILGNSQASDASVIYYGLPDTDSPQSPSQSKIEPSDLLYVGTANHRKRINSLPFVLSAVREVKPDARLRLIGFELEAQPTLRHLFAELDLLDAVDCVGPKLSKDLPPYYEASKILLVPSAHEGLPMVILEAQQCGLPCIVTRVSGHPEVIENGSNGFLVNLDDPLEMADRCVELLENPQLQERMSQAARKVVHQKFHLDRQVAEYLELYQTFVAK
jgi:glycosyltransferase involved in cell wall biosynthesis